MKPVVEIVGGWAKVPEPPEMTDAERLWLAQACQPGMPLWKVLKSAFDFAEHLKDHIAAVPLVSEDQIKLARQLQMQREAALNFMTWVAQCTQAQPQKAQPDAASPS